MVDARSWRPSWTDDPAGLLDVEPFLTRAPAFTGLRGSPRHMPS
ncbi:hypothetical protein SBD_4829 [Streptomyces bottropensis ATCC 25435]|uniref:Uncharacterized protein n=1 Tax=Streptomyces bottropensis ATCC 25435 TaxID=1054862 RepID=M3FK34_9ACTN|nr:hypothetical protein SBD_4829 [Streptomyces bottropensis ATCC 25435]